jgi:hypothetical protein
VSTWYARLSHCGKPFTNLMLRGMIQGSTPFH